MSRDWFGTDVQVARLVTVLAITVLVCVYLLAVSMASPGGGGAMALWARMRALVDPRGDAAHARGARSSCGLTGAHDAHVAEEMARAMRARQGLMHAVGGDASESNEPTGASVGMGGELSPADFPSAGLSYPTCPHVDDGAMATLAPARTGSGLAAASVGGGDGALDVDDSGMARAPQPLEPSGRTHLASA